MNEGHPRKQPALLLLDCPKCGAPLTPADSGALVECKFCGATTTAEPGGAAMRREQESRKEAEALFASLGHGPSWSQRVAAFLVQPKLWLFGYPVLLYLLMRISQAPEHLVWSWWEAHRHERLAHVVSPVTGWLVNIGAVATIVVAVLVWSLFGERVDARRDLQAALACKPPKTAGGKAHCRWCEAPLEVAEGALGVRCPFCSADNLLKIPPGWTRRAGKLEAKLRLSAKTARDREAEGRRRVRRAALWRVPFVFAMLALVALPALQRRRMAGWNDFKLRPENRVGLARLIVHHDRSDPTHELHSYAECDDPHAREAVFADAELAASASKWCEAGVCKLAAMFALSHGDRLRLVWAAPGQAHVRVALAPPDYLGNDLVLWDGFGDAVLEQDVSPGPAGASAVDVPIAISGWYKLDLRGAADVAIEPCVVPVTP
jgi:LSD1 subclass zinc finger protein